jgi:hypothetical protein
MSHSDSKDLNADAPYQVNFSSRSYVAGQNERLPILWGALF